MNPVGFIAYPQAAKAPRFSSRPWDSAQRADNNGVTIHADALTEKRVLRTLQNYLTQLSGSTRQSNYWGDLERVVNACIVHDKRLELAALFTWVQSRQLRPDQAAQVRPLLEKVSQYLDSNPAPII